ncbi:hypothetical protein K9M06_06105 [Candidatus Bipolaricaulota bacterium]|nr:hypothetical protein [Candidatus Bipolaricaulota bacterium]MCF7890677.1 hypothetical protein [Candidatus Bipolaricaulota bacterium]
MLIQGCCGWGYFKPNSFLEEAGKLTGEEYLKKLRDLIEEIDSNRIYLLWNNYNMYRDLKKFESLLSQ